VTPAAQRGFSLIEAMVATAIVATAAGSMLFALNAFAKFSAHQAGPNREAAMLYAQQSLRVAEDVWKYGAQRGVPSGTQQIADPISATVTTSITPIDAASASITVTVAYTPDPNHADPGSVSMSGILEVKAPVPGSRIVRPGLIASPSGAP
jgi:prepilin-type N-terminal cleavage/methylation domain-containing protein